MRSNEIPWGTDAREHSSGLKINRRKKKHVRNGWFRYILNIHKHTPITIHEFCSQNCFPSHRIHGKKTIWISYYPNLPVPRGITARMTPTCIKLEQIKTKAIFSGKLNIILLGFSLFFFSFFDVKRSIANRMHSCQTTVWLHQRK